MHIENATKWKRNLPFQKDKWIICWHAKFQSAIEACCSVRNAEVAQFFIVLRGGHLRGPFRRIWNFSILRRKQSALELSDIIFEKGSSKGPLGKNKVNNEILQLSRDSIYLQSVALKSIITTREAALHCSFYILLWLSFTHALFKVFPCRILFVTFCYVSYFVRSLFFPNRLFWNIGGPGENCYHTTASKLPLCTNLRLGCKGFHGEGVYAFYFASKEVMARAKSFFDDVKKEIECPVCQTSNRKFSNACIPFVNHVWTDGFDNIAQEP